MRKIDITGKRYGRLTALYENGHNNRGYIIWHCICDCGNETNIEGISLRAGRVKSCGCLWHEYLTSKENCHNKTHGMKNTRIYRIWRGMKLRCYNPNSPTYKYYGARGIKVCDSWRDSFEAFYNDMKDGYSDELSIDRIDFNGNYEPSNCRWATIIEQANNTRSNKVLTVYGKTDTVKNLCRTFNKNYDKVQWHLRQGKTIEKAFTY